MRHQIGFLLAVFFGTVWYGTVATVAGFIGLKRRPGSILDTAGRDWAVCLLRSAGVTVTLEGFERVPREGPVIIAVNHQSFFDIIAVLGTVPLPLRFIAKKELLRYPFFGTAIKAAGHILIDRFNRVRAFEAYEKAGRELRERRAHVVVFPEGTRSRTGRLLPFKKGPAVFAISSGTPVVPAYCAGTYDIQPKGSWFIRPRAVTIHFGPPLSVEGLTHEDRDAFTERMREAMVALRAGSVDAAQDQGGSAR